MKAVAVLAEAPPEGLEVHDVVQITGTVQVVHRDSFGQDSGITEDEGQPAISATRLEVLQERADEEVGSCRPAERTGSAVSGARDTFYESTTGRVIAAAALVVAVASAAYQFVNDQGEPGIRFVLLALLTGLIWWGRVPAVFAAAFGVFTLLAAWASVEHWYRGIPGPTR